MKPTTRTHRPILATATALLLTLGLTATAAHAQGPGGPPPPMPRGGPGSPGGPGGPGGLPPNPLQDLLRELDLTADQKTAVQGAVDSANAQIKAINLDAQAKTVAAVTAAAATIRTSLTADQQAELDVFLKRLAKHLARAQAATQ